MAEMGFVLVLEAIFVYFAFQLFRKIRFLQFSEEHESLLALLRNLVFGTKYSFRIQNENIKNEENDLIKHTFVLLKVTPFLTIQDSVQLSSTCKLLRSNDTSPLPLYFGKRLRSILTAGMYLERDHLLWQFTSLPFQVQEIFVICEKFVDQGWGNRKGKLIIEVSRGNPKEDEKVFYSISPFYLAPHEENNELQNHYLKCHFQSFSPIHTTFGLCLTKILSTDRIRIFYHVGGGGGHKLLLSGCKIILKSPTGVNLRKNNENFDPYWLQYRVKWKRNDVKSFLKTTFEFVEEENEGDEFLIVIDQDKEVMTIEALNNEALQRYLNTSSNGDDGKLIFSRDPQWFKFTKQLKYKDEGSEDNELDNSLVIPEFLQHDFSFRSLVVNRENKLVVDDHQAVTSRSSSTFQFLPC